MSGLVYKMEDKWATLVIYQGETIAKIIPEGLPDGSMCFNVINTSESYLNKVPLLTINQAKAVVEYYLELNK